MKHFSCGDVVAGCTAQFSGKTEAELLQQVAEHARSGHGMTSIPDGLVDSVRAKIRDVHAQ